MLPQLLFLQLAGYVPKGAGATLAHTSQGPIRVPFWNWVPRSIPHIHTWSSGPNSIWAPQILDPQGHGAKRHDVVTHSGPK